MDETLQRGAVNSGSMDPQPAISDRRLYRRYDIGIEAQLIFEDGSTHPCAITDLSLGGGAVEPGAPEWCDQNIRLVWPDLCFEGGLQGRLVHAQKERAHIAFDLDEQMESALTMFLVMSPATR